MVNRDEFYGSIPRPESNLILHSFASIIVKMSI